jgi:hypothetical protein
MISRGWEIPASNAQGIVTVVGAEEIERVL